MYIFGDNEAEIGIAFSVRSGRGSGAATTQIAALAHTRERPDDSARPLLRSAAARLDYAGALKEASDETKAALAALAGATTTLPSVNPPRDALDAARTAAQTAWQAVGKARAVIDRTALFLPSSSLDALAAGLKTQVAESAALFAAFEKRAALAIIPPAERNAFLQDVASSTETTATRARYYGKLGREIVISAVAVGEGNGRRLAFFIDVEPAGELPLPVAPETGDPIRGTVSAFATAQAGQKISFAIRAFAVNADALDQRTTGGGRRVYQSGGRRN